MLHLLNHCLVQNIQIHIRGDDITTETGFYFSENEDFSPSRGIIVSEASNKEFSRLAQDLYTGH